MDDSVYRQEKLAMSGYIGIIGLITITMVYSIFKIFAPQSHIGTWNVFYIAFLWAVYNSYVLFLALREIFTKKTQNGAREVK